MPPRRHIKRDQAVRISGRDRDALIIDGHLPTGKIKREVGCCKVERRIKINHRPIGLIRFTDDLRAVGQRGSILSTPTPLTPESFAGIRQVKTVRNWKSTVRGHT